MVALPEMLSAVTLHTTKMLNDFKLLGITDMTFKIELATHTVRTAKKLAPTFTTKLTNKKNLLVNAYLKKESTTRVSLCPNAKLVKNLARPNPAVTNSMGKHIFLLIS